MLSHLTRPLAVVAALTVTALGASACFSSSSLNSSGTAEKKNG